MAMYTVTTTQMLTATLMSALISAGTVVGYQQYRDKLETPQVHVSEAGTCIKVMNFKNGDAYNCEDVDVVLRSYRRFLVPTPKTSTVPDK